MRHVVAPVLGILLGSLATGACDGAPYEDWDGGVRATDAGPADAGGPVYEGTLPGRQTRYRVLRGRGPGKGTPLRAAELHAALAAADAVCLGEYHSDDDFHAAQLLLLDRLLTDAGAARRMAMGMEMFQTPFQDVLDDYVAGRINEAALLTRTQWRTRWGYDYAFYRPLVLRAVQGGAGLVALNAPTELTRKVSMGGGLQALTPEERAALPELDLGNAEHRAWFRQALGPSLPVSAERLEVMYTIQVIWDETMAESAWRWMQAAPGPRQIALIAGAGHCMDLAIPARLRRRGAAQVVSVRPVPDEPEDVEQVLEEGFSDFVLPFRL